jgi:type IV pilus biogenesis protein CpaD/CtpE
MRAPTRFVVGTIVLILTISCLGTAVHAQQSDSSEEIPIERCDVLPVLVVKVAGADMRFLLDTGATTILNLKSFSSGKAKEIHIDSWKGSAATSAREVTLPELQLGSYKLHDVKLPAIDLSPIGKACGGQIDGILGVDLLN